MFSSREIIKAKTMKDNIERTRPNVDASNAPRMAIQSIRSVIGVFKYMQEPKVAEIFKAEKKRIGAVIEGIDKNLPKTPRMVSDRTYKPWKTLGLGAKWDSYMDEVFLNASTKGTKFVNDNIESLKAEYTSQAAKDKEKDNPGWAELRKDIESYIQALEKEWEKSKDWKKPW